jgi:curli biogenesis system outer membrane secretion channel CsgG
MFKDFASKLHSVIGENLAQTKELSVLDRQHLTLTDQELGVISSNGNMQELAKLGNKAGGDLMLIPIIDKFKYRIDRREIGAQIIERTVYDVTLSIKVIEVATSNIVDTKNFSVKNKKIKSDEPSVDIALFLAKRAMRHVSKVVGGGYVDGYTEDHKVQPDMKVVKAASEKDFQEAKDNVKDDW